MRSGEDEGGRTLKRPLEVSNSEDRTDQPSKRPKPSKHQKAAEPQNVYTGNKHYATNAPTDGARHKHEGQGTPATESKQERRRKRREKIRLEQLASGAKAGLQHVDLPPNIDSSLRVPAKSGQSDSLFSQQRNYKTKLLGVEDIADEKLRTENTTVALSDGASMKPPVDISDGLTVKAKKRKRRRSQKSSQSRNQVGDPIQENVDPPVGDLTGANDRPVLAASTALGPSIRIPSASTGRLWHISPPTGGRFLSIDPVFSNDEKFFILATPKSIEVYAVEDSLLVRRIGLNPLHSVVSFCLSATSPDCLYVATRSGTIMLFDWPSGEQLGEWQQYKGCASSIIAVRIEGFERDTLYTFCERATKSTSAYHVSCLAVNKKSPRWKHRFLWSSEEPISLLQVLDNGRVAVAISENKLAIGIRSDPGSDDLSKKPQLNYNWRNLTCTETITSSSARIRPKQSTGFGKRRSGSGVKSASSESILDLAVGTTTGSIFIFDDVLSRLESLSSSKDPTKIQVLPPRSLHWHRRAVAALKWSTDGNYLISGGNETVLVLWQLETGKRQDLPHLTAPIVSIALSPTGTAYAVQLADNSVMILSTSELQPKAHVAGIQARTIVDLPRERTTLQYATLEASLSHRQAFYSTPIVANPQYPNQILVAVPSSQNQGQTHLPSAAPFLQIYDVFTRRHVSRQALTRNTTTVMNVGPEGSTIIEPNITHMQISNDGQWLATVEDWIPPLSDVKEFAFDGAAQKEKTESRRQCYLKFWMWNLDQYHWMLEARIDSPHQSTSETTANRVFDLVSHPHIPGFATIGADGFARTWIPKTTNKDGTVTRGAQTGGIISWSCQFAVELEQTASSSEGDNDATPPACVAVGKLSYSEDASIIAAALEGSDSNSAGSVQFIDAVTGNIRYTKPAMYQSGLAGIAFVERYLIVLSNDLRVWDVVSDNLVYGFELNLPKLPTLLLRDTSLLASNKDAFAVALPTTDVQGEITMAELRSSIIVFDPRSPTPLFSAEMSNLVTALVPKQQGFVILDSAAEVRTLTPATASMFRLRAVPEASSTQAAPAEKAEIQPAPDDEEDQQAVAGADDDDDEPTALEEDRPVVRPQQLAEALDRGPSFALPNVRELFGSILGLYGRRRRS